MGREEVKYCLLPTAYLRYLLPGRSFYGTWLAQRAMHTYSLQLLQLIYAGGPAAIAAAVCRIHIRYIRQQRCRMLLAQLCYVAKQLAIIQLAINVASTQLVVQYQQVSSCPIDLCACSQTSQLYQCQLRTIHLLSTYIASSCIASCIYAQNVQQICMT